MASYKCHLHLVECDEYAKLIKRRIQVASLSLDSTAQDITVTQCDAVTGLVVGGVEASPGEFPHMAGKKRLESFKIDSKFI